MLALVVALISDLGKSKVSKKINVKKMLNVVNKLHQLTYGIVNGFENHKTSSKRAQEYQSNNQQEGF